MLCVNQVYLSELPLKRIRFNLIKCYDKINFSFELEEDFIMKKRLFSLLLVATIIAGALSGCGSSESSDSVETTTEGTVYKVGIIQYVDDASLNQIVSSLEEQLDVLAEENGCTFEYEDYYCNGQADSTTINQMVTELINDDVDVLVPIATPTAMICQSATEDNQIPVIFAAVSDPEGAGLVESNDAPGSNVTGTSDALNTDAVFGLDSSVMNDPSWLYDAIESGDMENLKEELGDVLLQVVLHSQIADDEGCFNIDDVSKVLNEKLIHRHPHVFGNQKVSSTEDILNNWDLLKKEEKKDRKSAMDGICKGQSALMSAQKISKKAVKVGFEWANEDDLYACVQSEIKEFKEANTPEDKEEELGDILFAIVNLARWNKIDAEQALLRANKKFEKRFRKMEELATKPLEEYSFDEYDALWKQAKKY